MEYKDLHDFIKQLTEDETFIDWVRSDFSFHDDQWSVFIDEHMEHMDAINEAIKIVRDLNFKENSTTDVDALWSRIETSTHLKGRQNSVILNIRYLVAVAAAACIGLLVFFKGGFSSDGSIDITAAVAQITKEILPDQSEVTLSPGTKLSYNTDNWSKDRKLDLEGLAFFDVKKGETFTVQTAKGTVTVLGTSFSVDTRFGKFEVVCKTGKVKVEYRDGSAKILNPGEMVSDQNGTLIMAAADHDDMIPWLNGTYTFENTAFSNVIMELENQFDIKIEIDESYLNQKYTGYFKQGKLEDALFSVTWPMKLKFEIKGSVVHMTAN
jgi:ferric-dicitrate binding protein FerR (iron transport regulator)